MEEESPITREMGEEIFFPHWKHGARDGEYIPRSPTPRPEHKYT